MNPDWSFNVDDRDARLTEPPDDVSLPVRQAADDLRLAMTVCRGAALNLGTAVRAASLAGYGTRWILGAAGLSSDDLAKVLRGEELY